MHICGEGIGHNAAYIAYGGKRGECADAAGAVYFAVCGVDGVCRICGVSFDPCYGAAQCNAQPQEKDRAWLTVKHGRGAVVWVTTYGKFIGYCGLFWRR